MTKERLGLETSNVMWWLFITSRGLLLILETKVKGQCHIDLVEKKVSDQKLKNAYA
jgi:hypothetical protein